MCASINIPQLFPFPFQMMSVSIIFGIMVAKGMSDFLKYFVSRFCVLHSLYSSQDFFFLFLIFIHLALSYIAKDLK